MFMLCRQIDTEGSCSWKATCKYKDAQAAFIYMKNLHSILY